MSIVHIRVGGREYDVACDNGQEEHLRFLADDIDERLRALSFGMGAALSEPMGLLLAALMLADELSEMKQEIKKSTAMAHTSASDIAETRMAEIENAMAGTLEEIAARIEKIADQVELQ